MYLNFGTAEFHVQFLRKFYNHQKLNFIMAITCTDVRADDYDEERITSCTEQCGLFLQCFIVVTFVKAYSSFGEGHLIEKKFSLGFSECYRNTIIILIILFYPYFSVCFSTIAIITAVFYYNFIMLHFINVLWNNSI